MSLVDHAFILKLVAAERSARCVVGWIGDTTGPGEAISVHSWRYTTPTGNARECVRCGEFKHYGPRLDERFIRRSP